MCCGSSSNHNRVAQAPMVLTPDDPAFLSDEEAATLFKEIEEEKRTELAKKILDPQFSKASSDQATHQSLPQESSPVSQRVIADRLQKLRLIDPQTLGPNAPAFLSTEEAAISLQKEEKKRIEELAKKILNQAQEGLPVSQRVIVDRLRQVGLVDPLTQSSSLKTKSS